MFRGHALGELKYSSNAQKACTEKKGLVTSIALGLAVVDLSCLAQHYVFVWKKLSWSGHKALLPLVRISSRENNK